MKVLWSKMYMKCLETSLDVSVKCSIRGIRDILTEKVTMEQRPRGGEWKRGLCHSLWGNVLGRKTSQRAGSTYGRKPGLSEEQWGDQGGPVSQGEGRRRWGPWGDRDRSCQAGRTSCRLGLLPGVRGKPSAGAGMEVNSLAHGGRRSGFGSVSSTC